jgi:ATP-dependent Clp protease adaptor protein ClpS
MRCRSRTQKRAEKRRTVCFTPCLLCLACGWRLTISAIAVIFETSLTMIPILTIDKREPTTVFALPTQIVMPILTRFPAHFWEERLPKSVLDAASQELYMNSGAQPLDFPELEDDVATALSSRVILFNDEWHTFDEVIEQIIKATGCSVTKAESLTLEVHNAGKAMVYEGDFEVCLRVSNILEEIYLRTQIEC